MKVLTFGLLLVACFAVLTVACAPQTAQESPELAARADTWDDLLNSGDIDGLVALYAEDCRLLPPNQEMAHGTAAARAEFGGMIDAGLTIQLDTTQAMVAGDLGYRIGAYLLKAPDGSTLDQGKFIDTWRKDGAEWKIADDIWNSDMPVAEANVLVTHKVKDGEHWVAAWSGDGGRHEYFAKGGAPKVDVFRSPNDPNHTGLAIQVTDMAAFQTMLESEEGVAAKAADGVIDRSMQVFLKVE